MTETPLAKWERAMNSGAFSHLPSRSELSKMDKPKMPLPSSHLVPSELSGFKLSEAINAYTTWEAWSTQTAGAWRAEEVLVEQKLNMLKRFKYMNIDRQGKTVSAIENEVGIDEEVLAAEMELAQIRSEAKAFENNARSYGKMAMNYATERKHREVASYDPERQGNGKIGWDQS